MANVFKKIKEGFHREKDELKGKTKPKVEHAQEAMRDTGQKLNQKV